MNRKILIENENKRLNIRLPLLICFSMFAVWQMGMMYFSGQTMSVDGRTPLPVNVVDITVLIAAGYILSILVMCFMPRIIVWTERITASIALLFALALFLPLWPEFLAFALYVQFFCCLLMIGFETAIIVGLFSEKTAVLHLTAVYGVANILIALLQNDFIKISFSAFRLFTIAALVLTLIFFFKLPNNAWTRTVKRSDGLVAPKKLFAGIFLWAGMSCFVILFGIAVAEGFTHGVSVFYVSAAICGIAVYLLWKRFGVMPFRIFSVLVSMGAMGFVLAIAALYLSSLSLVACIFLGIGSVSCWLNPLFGVLLSKRYPSKFIAPGIIGIAFVAALIHSALLDALRNNTTVLYVVYLVIAVGMVMLYLLLEPYLIYSFHGKSALEAAIEESRGADKEPPLTKEQQNLCGNAFDKLTKRELEVADSMLKGMSYTEIAKEFEINPSTVLVHQRNLYSKLQIHSKTELLRVAINADFYKDSEE